MGRYCVFRLRRVLLASAFSLFLFVTASGVFPPLHAPVANACYTWAVGNRVGLRNGTEIREGSGFGYFVHTRLREDNWQVDIIGGPRFLEGQEWWDVSRKNLDNGGTGWVYKAQAGYDRCGNTGGGGSVSVDRAWTNDGGGDWSPSKTIFNRGDSIRYVGTVNNQTGGKVTATLAWDVRGPGGQIAYWSGNLEMDPGVWRWGWDNNVPSDATPGAYTFSFSSNYNGETSSQTTTFSIQGQTQQQTVILPATLCLTPPQYRAEYFNNRTLSGNSTWNQCENEPISPVWGPGGPGRGVAPDNFSARWTGRFHFDEGDYTFIAVADDGMKVWVDGNLIIDAWRDQPETRLESTRYMTGGAHDIKVEYYENGGQAVAQVWWERRGGTTTSGCLTVPTGQFCAEYFNSRDLSGPVIHTRNENNINYDWSGGGPDNGVARDNFSARWTGRFNFREGTYRFIARADDGIRAWIDGYPILEEWHDQPPTPYQAFLHIAGGDHNIKVEFYENGGGAVAQFRWQEQGTGVCETRLEAHLTDEQKRYFEKACYDPGNGPKAGMQLTLTDEGVRQCWFERAWCTTFARWVIDNSLWLGDRPLSSVSTEIDWHLPKIVVNQVVNRDIPIHVEYKCSDLRFYEVTYKC